ncbi:MAG: hypothetical protein ACWA5T_04360 [Parvularcula sp.]
MSHLRLNTALSLATVIAAASAVFLSAAQAETPAGAEEALVSSQIADFTARTQAQLTMQVAEVELPAGEPRALASVRLHGGPPRIVLAANLGSDVPVLVSPSPLPSVR